MKRILAPSTRTGALTQDIVCVYATEAAASIGTPNRSDTGHIGAGPGGGSGLSVSKGDRGF